MKILFFSEFFFPQIDGIGDYTYLLSEELIKQGQDVEVVTLSESEKKDIEKRSPLKITRLNLRKNQFYHNEVISILKEIQPDIIHFQVAISISKSQMWIYSILVLPSLIKKKLPKTKVIYTFHQYPCQFINKSTPIENFVDIAFHLAKHIYSFILNKTYNWYVDKFVDYVFIADPRYGKFIQRNSNLEFSSIPSNIPSLEITNTERKLIRQKYGLNENELVIGYFGKIFQEKNFEATIRILKEIPASKLLYIGKLSGKYPLVKKINSIVKRYNLSTRIIETGYIPAQEVSKCLNAIDVYISLFQDGVSPKNASFLAATAQGTFAITTSLNKVGYYPQENVFYVLPPGDIGVVVEAVKKYAGKKIKPNKFLWPQWNEVARQHIEVYNALVSR